ncbi:hypothetical protein [Hyalangium rubrum]|uniref:Alginate lyase domain-containing protein n=1 Tax=Hyalangium rubrum TaxID=3103134 RepID=A0ABU5H3S0_9BACT|nr:hypothetical protein [Hyalangium sp. s54d21]MDY7228107.1 hypothetical protein [Hyalangium sp. s54d21]
MLDFSHRSTRGLAMASLLSLSLLTAVACDPNAAGMEEYTGEETAPTTAEEIASEVPGGSIEANSDETPAAANGELAQDMASEPDVTTQALPSGMRTVAQWETLFLGRWNTEHTGDFLPKSKSLDSWQFYNLAYGIDGNTAMYRATGKTQYLDRALLYVNNVVANAKVSSSLPRSQYKDSYLGWASARSDTLGQEVPLFESYCWRYVTRLLRVIRETPALYGNATYRSQYDRLLAFTERNMFEKWLKRGANANIYRVNTHMASHWAYMAMDLSRMTTDATKKATYLTVFNNINRKLPNYSTGLRGQMRTSPINATAYYWDDNWGSIARPGQDVAHGNGVMAYIVEARDAGMEWTDTDIRAFTATLNSVIWPSASRYAAYVDGSGSGTGWFNDGLMKLGRYNAALQKRLEAHGVGRNTQYYGNGALNARILSGT